MGQILEPGQIPQLDVQRVDDCPAVTIGAGEEYPQEAHQDVVGENHIVHDREKQERQQAEQGEDAECHQPRHDLLFVLLRGNNVGNGGVNFFLRMKRTSRAPVRFKSREG